MTIARIGKRTESSAHSMHAPCGAETHHVSEKGKLVKKSIAILSLGLTATLGLVACGETTQTTITINRSASPESQMASNEAPVKAEEETAGADSTQDASDEKQVAEDEESKPTDSNSGAGNQKSFKETIEEAKKSPASKKSTNADGTVYTSSLGDEIAIVEANNGDDIIIKKDGSWGRVTPDGSIITVEADGSWHAIMAGGRLINVESDGMAQIIDFKNEVNEESYASLEVPQTPAPVEALNITPKEPVKPTKRAHSWDPERASDAD